MSNAVILKINNNKHQKLNGLNLGRTARQFHAQKMVQPDWGRTLTLQKITAK